VALAFCLFFSGNGGVVLRAGAAAVGDAALAASLSPASQKQSRSDEYLQRSGDAASTAAVLACAVLATLGLAMCTCLKKTQRDTDGGVDGGASPASPASPVISVDEKSPDAISQHSAPGYVRAHDTFGIRIISGS
jgi:hypothetical protein